MSAVGGGKLAVVHKVLWRQAIQDLVNENGQLKFDMRSHWQPTKLPQDGCAVGCLWLMCGFCIQLHSFLWFAIATELTAVECALCMLCYIPFPCNGVKPTPLFSDCLFNLNLLRLIYQSPVRSSTFCSPKYNI